MSFKLNNGSAISKAYVARRGPTVTLLLEASVVDWWCIGRPTWELISIICHRFDIDFYQALNNENQYNRKEKIVWLTSARNTLQVVTSVNDVTKIWSRGSLHKAYALNKENMPTMQFNNCQPVVVSCSALYFKRITSTNRTADGWDHVWLILNWR